MKRSDSPKNLIQSIERALNIMEVIRDRRDSVRAADIARAVGLSPAAANNILRTLFVRNYLAQDDQGRYILGHNAYLLGLAADSWNKLRGASEGPISELAKKTGNLCALSVRDSQKIILIEMARGSSPVALPPSQDWLEKYHCTAAGKLFLAFMPSAEYEEFKRDHQLERFTEATITDWDQLDQEIEKVRKNGYSISKDEHVYGCSVIGAPVKNSQGELIAALIISFSSYFYSNSYNKETLASLKRAVKKIETAYLKN